MDIIFNQVTLAAIALVLGAIVFGYGWLESRAYDRKWGHLPHALGE